LRSLNTGDMQFALQVLQLLPAQVVRENWPYGVLL
jgi:citrate lyase subunit beta / citryl-CoA lyase